MVDSISDDEWERIEARVIKNIPIGSVRTPEQLKIRLLDRFFGGKDSEELTKGQRKFFAGLWDDLADKYEVGAKEKPVISINLRENPQEARRFSRATKLYHNILRMFDKGYNRKYVAKYYAKKTKRKESTVNRDISALVKLGVIYKRQKGKTKGRGFYKSKSHVYT